MCGTHLFVFVPIICWIISIFNQYFRRFVKHCQSRRDRDGGWLILIFNIWSESSTRDTIPNKIPLSGPEDRLEYLVKILLRVCNMHPKFRTKIFHQTWYITDVFPKSLVIVISFKYGELREALTPTISDPTGLLYSIARSRL